MVVRNSLKWATLIGILCTVRATSERWSRQIANSEWVPLADPRNGQTDRGSISVAAPSAAIATDSGFQASGRVPAVALPPVLQQQYQDQLLKLHKTHESIQRLLALQQQLKAQQQLLRSHAYEPNGFPNSEDEKQALHQSTIVNLQTFPQLAPEVLVPPVPSSHALPPAFQAQDFRSSNSELRFDDRNHQVPPKLKANVGPNFGQIHEGSIIKENVEIDSRPKQKKWFETALKQQEEPTHINFVTPGAVQLDNGQEQEVQLVYVPAETLAQRAQTKLQRPKDTQLPPQYKNDKETASAHLNPQDAYAREILHHLQKQHEEKNQNLNAERQREVDRLNTEQRELESRARLQQELARREQELMRQRGAEKKKKEVERMEENARQLELQKMREAREKEEMRRQEAERIANLIRDREVKTRFESVNGHGLRGVQSQTYETQHPQAQPLVREQQTYHQHLTEVTQKDPQSFRASSKQKNQSHQFQQQGYQQGGVNPQQTLPPPNQPPLSVYMGDSASDQSGIKLADVLTSLRNARTIAVLDTFGPDSPRVFVGPRDLDTPRGYAKFDLPYLSSIENNRVGRGVDKVPFFVAPLSFEPPPGYSKIPFPAPHIGSIVINAAGNIDPQLVDAQDPSPTPLIEPNSYLVGNQQLSGYSNTPIPYAPTTSSHSYDVTSPVTSKPPSNKWRSDSFGGAKPSTESPTLPTVTPYQDVQSTMAKFDPPFKSKSYYSLNEVSTTPSYYSPKTVTAFSFEQMPPHSTPSYHDAQSTRVQDLHSISQDERRQPVVNAYRKNGAFQTNQHYPANPTSQGVTNSYYVDPAHVFEDQTQYNLPAELPAISPQLPGLVNALVEKNDGSSSSQSLTALPVTTPVPTITTTTTETPTTTHRPRTRQRGRVTASRPTTTQTPGSRDHSERARKPFNRSRSKYSTTTQDYSDSSYDPIRKNYATTSRYQGSGNYSQVDNHNGVDQRKGFHGSSAIAESNPQVSEKPSSLDESAPVYQVVDVYPTSTGSSFDSQLPQHLGSAISDSLLPLSGLEYPRQSSLAPNYVQTSLDPEQQQHQVGGLDHRGGGYYQPYSKPAKTESSSTLYEPIVTTALPNVQRSHTQDFAPVYHNLHHENRERDSSRPIHRKHGTQPLRFLPDPVDKPEEYYSPTIITETPTEASSAATTTPTTTPPPPSTIEATPPTVIRQKVRARLSGSQQQQRQPDSAIQTRSRGPHDEYVRFSAVNQQTQNSNSASARQSQTRPKTRTRTHSSASTTSQRNLPIQSEGPGLVRIHSAKNQSRTPPVRDNDDNADEHEHEDRFDEPKPTHAQNAYTSTESSLISHQSKIRQRSQQNSRRPTSARIRTNAAAYVEDEDIATSVTKLPRSRGRTQNAPLSSSMEQEHKPSKPTRARNRRPAVRQRPVTAGVNRALSETSPESSNELDENYPRASARPETQQHSLENENYPQEFLLNYGASQSYDDGSTGPVASGLSTKSDKTNSADIHGAESQWSTKLSGNSFQPSNSAPNRADGESDKIFQPLAGDKAGDFSEIITAGPEQSSVTMLVSSDDSGAATDLPGPSSEESLVGSMIGSLVDFGKKMNGEAQPDSALDIVETAENPRDKGPSSTQAALEDFNNKATGSTFKKARLRQRRVRIRVKPASSSSEDFVTAESQGYESSLNKLPQEPIKFRNFYRTTQVTTSTTSETTPAALMSTVSPATERSKSLFDDLLGIENEAATTIPTTPKTTTITTTTVSEMVTTIIPTTTTTTRSTTNAEEDTWTSPLTSSTTSSIELPATTLEIGGEHTTLIEHQSTENLTSPTTTTTKESSRTGSAERIAAVTTTTAWQPVASNSGQSIIQSLNSDNSLRYFEAKSPAYNEYLRSQEQSKSSELSDAGGLDPKQPKNHRSKWSEVRQLSDKWSNSGAPAGPTNQSEAGVTDYVKAVFESIKNAGEGDNALPQTVQQPAELVKTSVSSSSRVVARPASSQLLFGQRRGNGGMSSSASEATTTTATQTQTPSPTMTELVTFGPFVPSIMSDRQQQPPKKTSLEMNLGKILRTSTTTKVSHMTEICYRGRCVMSKPKKEGLSR